ncbi:MAG TPA: hypothetical protein VFX49_09835 [Chloroflexota bacterium]|nr:hypothetical protein [Chloroflexota bacterium]
MPDKRFRPRRLPKTERRDSRAGTLKMQRAAVPHPGESLTLRPAPSDGGSERWELTCRDGWDWQVAPASQNAGGNGRPTVWVRTAILTGEQAAVVRQWLDRIGDPATWWAVSRALQEPDSAPNVAPALREHPWLQTVLPAVLEASTEGAPPPPPAPRS